MTKRILVLQGHPDASQQHLLHMLADAYAAAAQRAGHEVRTLRIADLDFPLLRSQQEWEHEPVPASLAQAQADIGWAQHLVLFFPLWLGDMPALVKGFLEQVARPGFAFDYPEGKPFAAKRLTGRSARVVVTMGMPAIFYRWYFRAHSVKSLERNILGFVGYSPVRATLIGMTGGMKLAAAQKWKRKIAALGKRGD
ncbi:MAG TPA: NAD(P)H-dependent oxidoreductase [Ramlibacter sp.]|jgi:putative NADPH-quinone reductase